MSERFVLGWKVSPQKLQALVGSNSFTGREILASKANAKCKQDLLMTLGEGDENAGRQIAEGALHAISTGKLDASHAYHYARVAEPLLNHLARPLAIRYAAREREPLDQIVLQLTCYVPNEDRGRWGPLLKACDLPKLAKCWGAANVRFPWPSSRKARPISWPMWTLLDARTLADVAIELAGVTRQRVDAVPTKMLADNERLVAPCRAELWSGLERLRAWVETARAAEKSEGPGWDKLDNALMLLMDGDQ